MKNQWPKHPEKYRQIMCYALYGGLWSTMAEWMKARNLDDAGSLDEDTSNELLDFCRCVADQHGKTINW